MTAKVYRGEEVNLRPPSSISGSSMADPDMNNEYVHNVDACTYTCTRTPNIGFTL